MNRPSLFLPAVDQRLSQVESESALGSNAPLADWMRPRNLAAQLAANFGLEYHVVPIQEMVEAVQKGFEQHLHPIRSVCKFGEDDIERSEDDYGRG